jgi:hypothetical protein
LQEGNLHLQTFYESFSRILLDGFELEYSTECTKIPKVLESIDESYDLNELLSSMEMPDYCYATLTFVKFNDDNRAERSAPSIFG